MKALFVPKTKLIPQNGRVARATCPCRAATCRAEWVPPLQQNRAAPFAGVISEFRRASGPTAQAGSPCHPLLRHSILTALAAFLLATTVVWSRADTTIDATNRYSFGANVGWTDWLGDTNHGVVIGPQVCSGYIFSPTLGWINVGNGNPTNGVQYQNLSANDFGVNVDGNGNLRGFAFGANIGWVNFETNGAPQVDLASGKLSGFAFSPTCGWISLSNAVAYVQTVNPPAILTQPQSQTVTVGQTAFFKVVASGLPPLSYRWLFNGTNIPGATASDFARTNLQAADAGDYSVVVTNLSGSVTSAVATLVVGFPEIVVEQPAGTDLIDASSSVNFGKVFPGGTVQLTFVIRNTGNGDLLGLSMTIDGMHLGDFSVAANPAAVVPAGGSKAFAIRFVPRGTGARTATLHIASNDADESPFDITLTGTVPPPPPSGAVVTIAGNGTGGYSGDGGPATDARFTYLNHMAVGRDSTLYVNDADNYRIRAVNPASGVVTTVAGNGTFGEDGDGGPATNATIDYVTAGLAVDRQRNVLYFPDSSHSNVRQVDLTTGIISRFAGVGIFSPYQTPGDYGDGRPATQGWFSITAGVAVGRCNDVFIVDWGHCSVRKVRGTTGIIITYAGRQNPPGVPDCDYSGDGGDASLAGLGGSFFAATDTAGNLFIMESDVNGSRVRRIDVATHIITTVAGGGTSTNYNGPATNMNLTSIQDITMSRTNTLYIAMPAQVVKVDLATGLLSVFAGTGEGGFSGDGGAATNAQFNQIVGLAVAPGGGLFVADSLNLRIRYIAPESVSLVNDSEQTGLFLPWIGALTGNFTVTGNANLTTVSAGALTGIGGDLIVSNNNSAVSIDLRSLSNIGGRLIVTSNSPDAKIDLGSLNSVGTGTNRTTVKLSGGIITFGANLTIGTNATLTGFGTIAANVTNAGTISPGASPGRFDIMGRLVLTESSRLQLEIGGYAQSEVDFLSVTGSVTVGGGLSVSFINNFASVMTNGASFTLLTSANPITGAFANVASGGQLTTTDGRARFTVVYAGQNSVRLTNLEILSTSMDSDGDGVSDADEFAAGTDPHNPASVFRILGIQSEAGGIRITWSTVGGKSYRVQTNALLDGNFNFGDFSPLISVPGTSESTTNFVDPSTNTSLRFYRVRLSP